MSDLLDSDGYPTDAALARLRDWPTTDLPGAFAFAAELWKYPDYFKIGTEEIEAHTGGWSGNESVVGAMQDNLMLWTLCWKESRRGGHYKFEIPVNFRKPALAPKKGEPK